MSQADLSNRNEQMMNKVCLNQLMLQFTATFPTEKDCLKELYRLAEIEMRCQFCFGQSLQISANHRVGRCTDCNRDTWFTACTILEHVKKPFARLAAIWLMGRGAILKSTTFSKLVGVVQSSAHEILKWARVLIEQNMPADSPLVHSSQFSRLFNKRSLQTPANAHPRSEQAAIENLLELEKKDDHDIDIRSPVEKQVLDVLREVPVHTDVLVERTQLPIGSVLAALTMLELDGKIDGLPGGYYIKCRKQLNPKPLDFELSKAVEAFSDFICNNHGGISRRYLQSYLASFWYHLQCGSGIQEKLVALCLGDVSAGILNETLRNYGTPLEVRIASQ